MMKTSNKDKYNDEETYYNALNLYINLVWSFDDLLALWVKDTCIIYENNYTMKWLLWHKFGLFVSCFT